MNKANVFLLVVVSSLLTYISTATQPAATAGVAQEKWEYGKSAFLTGPAEGGGKDMIFEFSFIDIRLDTHDRRYVSFNNKSGLVTKYTFREPFIVTEEEVKGSENKFKFRMNVLMLWLEIGANGWEPYLVIPQNPSGTRDGLDRQYMDTVYWRRRVQ